MGINLDWNVEGERGWRPVEEDPDAVRARQRRARHLRRFAFAACALIVLAGSAAAIRLAYVRRELRRQLIATVAAETAALRIGDRGAFLALQAPDQGWPDHQSTTFDSYQAISARLDVTGEVVELEISADIARAILLERLDGEPYHVRWFYRRGAEGWRHSAPAASLWGEYATRETAHLAFEYYAADAPLVEALAPALAGWWETACRLTGCLARPAPITVAVVPDWMAATGWAAYDPDVLLIASPLLDRYPPNEAPDATLLLIVRELIARRWAEVAAAGVSDPDGRAWLEAELTAWLGAALGGDFAPGGFLAEAAASGPGGVVVFIEGIKAGRDPASALADARQTAGASPAEGTRALLTYRLRAEASLIAAGQVDRALAFYADPDAIRPVFLRTATEWAVPVSIEIVGMESFAGLLWAETRFEARPGAGLPEDVIWTTYEPFRQVDGQWLHTVSYLEDWGGVVEERTALITVQYFQLDAPTAAGLLVYLDTTYQAAARAMGVAPQRLPLLMTAISSSSPSAALLAERAGDDTLKRPARASRLVAIRIPSPHRVPRPAGLAPADFARGLATREMVAELVLMQSPSYDQDQPLIVAIVDWETARLGYPEQNAALLFPQPAGAAAPPSDLERLWPAEDNLAVYTRADYAACLALLDVIAERYGAEALAKLMPQFEAARSMAEWLRAGLGSGAGEIEAAWQERAKALIGE